MIRARVTLKKDNVLLLEILAVPEESFVFAHEGFFLKTGSFTQISGVSIFLPHPDEEDENKWRTFVDFKNERTTAHMWLDKIVGILRAYNDQFDF